MYYIFDKEFKSIIVPEREARAFCQEHNPTYNSNSIGLWKTNSNNDVILIGFNIHSKFRVFSIIRGKLEIYPDLNTLEDALELYADLSSSINIFISKRFLLEKITERFFPKGQNKSNSEYIYAV